MCVLQGGNSSKQTELQHELERIRKQNDTLIQSQASLSEQLHEATQKSAGLTTQLNSVQKEKQDVEASQLRLNEELERAKKAYEEMKAAAESTHGSSGWGLPSSSITTKDGERV